MIKNYQSGAERKREEVERGRKGEEREGDRENWRYKWVKKVTVRGMWRDRGDR